jgi:zinc transporter
MTTTDLPDVAPTTGIVWAYRFGADGAATRIANEQVDAALAAPDGGWVWVHLALADQRCRAWIAKAAPVSELARELLSGADTHLRLDSIGHEGHQSHELIGVLPDLHQEFTHASEDLVRLRFVMGPRLVITARQRPLHSVENTRRAVDAGKRFPSPVALLDAVIDQFADAIARMADQLGAELDAVEDHVMHEEPADERHRIGRVRLQAVRVHRQLAQLRSMFHRIEPRVARDNAAVAAVIGTLAQKLDGIDAEVAELHERARLLRDEMAAKMTEVTNRRLFTLSILTACLLPPTLVTGFFGMNTKDMPFQNADGGTWWALLVAAAAAALSYWALRRMRAF